MQTTLKIEAALPLFFSAPPKKIEVEEVPETGRVYFVYKNQIVAVAIATGPR